MIQMAPLRNFVEVNPESVTKTYPHDEILYIDISSVGSGYFAESPKLLSINESPSRAKRIVRDEDTILATVRPNLRSFMFIKEPDDNTVASTGFAVLRAKDNVVPRFIYYAVTDRRFTGYLTNNTKGTSYPAVDTATVLRGEIPDFNLRQQRIIASILSAYDDLIENNRRRIQLLEQAARLLYKEWFVHLRFPGYERAKIIDGVPEGWERKTLGEIADITMGQSPKSIYYNEDGDGLPFHQGVANFGVRFPSHQKYCAVQNRLANPGDILFSVRAPVGRINITMDKIVIGRGLAAIRSNRGQQNFLFYALKNHFFKDDLIGSGAIYAAITKKDLHEVELIQPSDLIARIFVERTTPIDCHIANLQRTIDKLTQARDLLLPRLMNGEVDHEPLVARQTQRDAPTGAKAS